MIMIACGMMMRSSQLREVTSFSKLKGKRIDVLNSASIDFYIMQVLYRSAWNSGRICGYSVEKRFSKVLN